MPSRPVPVSRKALLCLIFAAVISMTTTACGTAQDDGDVAVPKLALPEAAMKCNGDSCVQ